MQSRINRVHYTQYIDKYTQVRIQSHTHTHSAYTQSQTHTHTHTRPHRIAHLRQPSQKSNSMQGMQEAREYGGTFAHVRIRLSEEEQTNAIKQIGETVEALSCFVPA